MISAGVAAIGIVAVAIVFRKSIQHQINNFFPKAGLSSELGLQMNEDLKLCDDGELEFGLEDGELTFDE